MCYIAMTQAQPTNQASEWGFFRCSYALNVGSFHTALRSIPFLYSFPQCVVFLESTMHIWIRSTFGFVCPYIAFHVHRTLPSLLVCCLPCLYAAFHTRMLPSTLVCGLPNAHTPSMPLCLTSLTRGEASFLIIGWCDLC